MIIPFVGDVSRVCQCYKYYPDVFKCYLFTCVLHLCFDIASGDLECSSVNTMYGILLPARRVA